MQAGLEKRSVEEVALVEQALVRVIKRAAELPQPPKVDKVTTAASAKSFKTSTLQTEISDLRVFSAAGVHACSKGLL